MRILHIIASVDPQGGGPVEGILQQAATSSSHREIASLDDPASPFLVNFPIKVHPLGFGRSKLTTWRRYLPWIHYGYSARIVPWINANVHNFDIVVVNGLWNYAAFSAYRALKSSGMPYVVFTHGQLDPWFRRNYPIKTAVKQFSWWICEGPLLQRARAVFYTTEDERLLARTTFWPYKAQERVVGYGTGDITGDPNRQIAEFYAKIPELTDRPFLLFLSRIHPKKGCDLLIRAFASIAPRYPDVHLVIAGPNLTGWQSTLQCLASELNIARRIHWPGMLTGDSKWGAFRAASAFVLPSHSENFGIVVAEALAARTPVLISDKVNIWREVVENGGGFADSDTLEGVTRLLERFLVLAGPELCEMRSRARATFLSNFHMDKVINNIQGALQDCILHPAAMNQQP